MKKSAKRPLTPLAPPTVAAQARNKATLPETTEGLPWPSSHEIKKETNPFTDRDWRMWLYAWAGLLVRVMVIFGALFSIYQFLAAREQARVQRTFELVELWERSEYQAAQAALRQRLLLLNQKYGGDLGQNASPEDIAEYSRRIGLKAMSADGGDMPLAQFQEQFDRIVYFLNRVSSCVEGKLCSRDVADTYFMDYARSFWGYFAGYVADQRKAGATSFARPIETYVAQD